MRITQNYSIHSLLRQVNLTRERIHTLQRDIATGKRINQISDDPENIERVLRYRKMLTINQRFEENISNALDWMNFTSKVLDDASDVVAHIKELAIQGIDSTSDDEFQAILKQIEEMIKEFVQLANSRFKDRYIFGGSNTHQAPFVLAADFSSISINPEGIEGALKVEIGQGKIEQYNISGQEAFLGNIDIFQTLLDLRNAFINQDAAEISNQIDKVDQALNQLLETNTTLGARINRFEMVLEQYQNEDVRLQGFLSKIEDTDLAQAITDLQMEQTALETALRALAQTVNISLVDFVK